VNQPHDELRAIEESVQEGTRRGLLQNIAQDTHLDGRVVTVEGRTLVNFGSCSYLGLETHPALKAGVIDAVERFGTQFSCSRNFLSAPGYSEAEKVLSKIFGRPTLLTPTTTLGHFAALPATVGTHDALLLDHQVHSSVQSAAHLVGGQGSAVERVPHSRTEHLEKRVRALSDSHERVWYAADGLYSMYADFAPLQELNELMERCEQLWLYFDDAHSFSWTGRHGRGFCLEHLAATALSRSVVAGSLVKSFGAAGGVVTFPDERMLQRVFNVGGPMLFSGQVQPPMLGAVIASARIHLRGEAAVLQKRLLSLIRLFNHLAADRNLPLVSRSEAPIRCIGVGPAAAAYNLNQRLRDCGYFTNTAVYPAVPLTRSGIRVTLTCHHTEADIAAIVDALATALPAALKEEGSSMAEVQRAFARQLRGLPRPTTVPSA
jgi:7-keto-8-aminopelargonate synthetase-like enzyme